MRRLSQLQMDAIRKAAEQGKQPGNSTQSWKEHVQEVNDASKTDH